jgi:putative ABC transport system permease protein
MKYLARIAPGLFGRSRIENDMTDELRFHVESRTEHFIHAGLSRQEAARRARLEFGSVEAYKESCREELGFSLFDELRTDLRYAGRMLIKNLGFTGIAILSLALGIGVNISLFAFVNSIILRPYPYPGLDRIMTVWETIPKLRRNREPVAPANFIDWNDSSRTFDRLAAYGPASVNLTGVDDPERLQAALVTSGFFEVLGMKPTLGRTFSRYETQAGRDGVVVVSHAFWKNRLSSADDAVNKTLSVDGRSYTIAGVMPADFDFPLGTDIWIPLAWTPQERSQRAVHKLMVLGRLKPGIALRQASSEMDTIARRIEHSYPETNEGRGILMVPLREQNDQVSSRFALILLAAAIFVLLLACANVANLQLARATARQKEIGLRAALGASRFRIARQLLTESMLMAVLSGTVGLFLAMWDMRVNNARIPAQVFKWVPGLKTMHVDGMVVAWTFGLSLVVGLLCCLPSIVQLLREKRSTGLNEALKEGGRTSSAVPSRSRLRSVLVVSEVALALVLLVGAGLMVATFRRILEFNTGIDPKNLLTMEVSLSASKYGGPARTSAFYGQVIRALAVIPGVEAAGASAYAGRAEGVYIEGRPEPRPSESRPQIIVMSPQYYQTTRIPVLRGRSISEEDGPDATAVAVVSEAVARHYWPDSDPIGRRIRLAKSPSRLLTVVGVAGDVKDWFNGEDRPAVYVSLAQAPQLSMRLYLRTAGDPMQMANAARLQVRTVEQNQPVFNLKTMEDILSEETSGVRAAARIMSTYALIALLLATAGIYSVGSFFVVQRTHEIGVRMALGADRRQVVRMTLGQSLRMAAAGLSIGLLFALAMTRLMSHFLYNVVAVDPLPFAFFTMILGGAALLAAYIPARRAARVDPMIALRHE